MQSTLCLNLVKLRHSKAVHLCLTINGGLHISRCGLVCHDERSPIELVPEITIESKVCTKCAREEGVFRDNKKELSSKDLELEALFLEHLETQKIAYNAKSNN